MKKKEQKIIEDQKRIDPKIQDRPEGQLKNKEIKEKINLYMNTLSPKEKAIFLLRDKDGFSIIIIY